MFRMLTCKRIAPFFLALGFLVAPLASAEVIELDPAALKQLIAKGVTVVDVRTAGEWQQTGIVEGSRLVTLHPNKAGDAYDFAAWLADFRKTGKQDQPVVVMCRSGKRSSFVANQLDQKAGYAKVYNVTGGINRWIGEGNPTVPYEEQK